MSSITEKSKLNLYFLLVIILITLVFTRDIMPGYSLPKLCILTIGITFFSYLFFFQNRLKNVVKSHRIYFPVLIYMISFCIIALNTNQKFTTVLFGANGRYTGLITKLFLCIFLIYTIFIASRTLIDLTLKILSYIGFALCIIAYSNSLKSNGANASDKLNFNLSFNNTNFSSIFLCISTISAIYYVLSTKSIKIKIFQLSNFCFQSFSIFYVGDAQGYIILLISILLLIFFYLFILVQSPSWLKNALVLASSAFSIFELINLVNGKGFLSNILKVSSFQDRIFMWKYGFKMFRDNILFGVGLDSYGDWALRYTEQEHVQKLNLQADYYSLDPHNIFIQSAATGGIILLLSCIYFVSFITYRGITAIRIQEDKLLPVTIFILWVIFVFKDFISVDNLGIDIWKYLFGGYLIYLSLDQNFLLNLNSDLRQKGKFKFSKSLNSFNFLLISIFVLGPTVFTVNHLFVNYSLFKELRSFNKIYSSKSMEIKINKIENLVAQSPTVEIRVVVVKVFLEINAIDSAVKVSEKMTRDFPNRPEGWNALATIYEDLGQNNLAQPYRMKFLELNPLYKSLN
jgi:O-antigen ligase